MTANSEEIEPLAILIVELPLAKKSDNQFVG